MGEDDKGRHTTTHRELFILTSGGLVIDTPGMRELGVLENEEGLRAAFGDIDEVAAQCRFSDCQHGREPGCAVQQAVKEGRLSAERLEAFHKLTQEAARPEEDSPLRTRGRQEPKPPKGKGRRAGGMAASGFCLAAGDIWHADGGPPRRTAAFEALSTGGGVFRRATMLAAMHFTDSPLGTRRLAF